MRTRSFLTIIGIGGVLLAVLGCSPKAANAPNASAPIRIGDLNHYTGLPKFSGNYRKGWQLAVEQINAQGGVLGRQLEVISRDDGGRPEGSVRVAEELVKRDGAQFLIGTLFDHCGLAVAGWARQNRVLFIKPMGGTDAHVWQKGHRYAFRTGLTDTLLSGMLADEAAKLPAKRWATVAPNFEYGRSMARQFREQLQKRRPDIEWVSEQFPPLGKIDAGPVVEALKHARPEALLCVLFQTDVVQFNREGLKRGLLGTIPVVGPVTGIPEELEVLGPETPQGWITYGYPAAELESPEAKRFLAAYRAKFHEEPGMCSQDGYLVAKFLAEAIAKAGAADTERVIDALEGLRLESPVGALTMRAVDHQTDRGIWIGKTAVRDSRGVLTDYRYVPSAGFLPTEELIRKWRGH